MNLSAADEQLLRAHGFAVRFDGRVFDAEAGCWVNPAPVLRRLREGAR